MGALDDVCNIMGSVCVCLCMYLFAGVGWGGLEGVGVKTGVNEFKVKVI